MLVNDVILLINEFHLSRELNNPDKYTLFMKVKIVAFIHSLVTSIKEI